MFGELYLLFLCLKNELTYAHINLFLLGFVGNQLFRHLKIQNMSSPLSTARTFIICICVVIRNSTKILNSISGNLCLEKETAFEKSKKMPVMSLSLNKASQ